jgi:hypothetical protein
VRCERRCEEHEEEATKGGRSEGVEEEKQGTMTDDMRYAAIAEKEPMRPPAMTSYEWWYCRAAKVSKRSN